MTGLPNRNLESVGAQPHAHFTLQPQSKEKLVSKALELADKGYAVFPVKVDKAPACRNGFKDATQDPATIRRLFSRSDAAGVGVGTGRYGDRHLVVIDIDGKEDGKPVVGLAAKNLSE